VQRVLADGGEYAAVLTMVLMDRRLQRASDPATSACAAPASSSRPARRRIAL